jgi:hypothetical protein
MNYALLQCDFGKELSRGLVKPARDHPMPDARGGTIV